MTFMTLGRYYIYTINISMARRITLFYIKLNYIRRTAYSTLLTITIHLTVVMRAARIRHVRTIESSIFIKICEGFVDAGSIASYIRYAGLEQSSPGTRIYIFLINKNINSYQLYERSTQ